MEAKELYGRFGERGYTHQCIRRVKKRAMQADRGTLLEKTSSLKSQTQSQAPIRIITKYGAQWDQVKNILGHQWHILTNLSLARLSVTGDRSAIMES